ncbi:MAG: hypothetical protein QM398_02760 [Thermoproteota archaeon]|nr:hypothetical protein [Thermoproteota archaeon]NLD66469.1 hypothetical protein [Thermoproteota archaeon]
MKLLDYSYLEDNAKASLFLAWLSCKNFNLLLKEENYALIEEHWKETKKSLRQYFKNQPVNLDTIIKDFGKVTLTMRPQISFGYDYGRNVLLYHLWAFLFDLCGDFASSVFPAKLGGELVYQHDIYLFLKEHDIIGKSSKVKEAFRAQYGNEIEKRALDAQIDFLERCKSNDLLPLMDDHIKVTAWSGDGLPVLGPECEVYMISKPTIVALIDDLIGQYSEPPLEVENGQRFSEVYEEVDSQNITDLAKALSLPLKHSNKLAYPELTLKL